MPASQSFWDKAAEKYDRKTVKGPNYAARLDRAANWLGSTAKVLDVGCAGGQITLDLAPRIGSIHGIDISPKLIEIAKHRAAEDANTAGCVSFEAVSVEDVSLDGQSFDGITAYSVLHLVEDAPATLQCFARLLKPGGVLIAEVPCLEDIPWYFRMLIPMMTLLGKAPVVQLYPQATYRTMFEQAGFEIREIKVYNPASMNRSILAYKV